MSDDYLSEVTRRLLINSKEKTIQPVRRSSNDRVEPSVIVLNSHGRISHLSHPGPDQSPDAFSRPTFSWGNKDGEAIRLAEAISDQLGLSAAEAAPLNEGLARSFDRLDPSDSTWSLDLSTVAVHMITALRLSEAPLQGGDPISLHQAQAISRAMELPASAFGTADHSRTTSPLRTGPEQAL